LAIKTQQGSGIELIKLLEKSMHSESFFEIVVPTFNRAHILASALKELVAAVSTQGESIPLRVIDNCSTDDTHSVVRPYAEKGLLTYERNSTNIGLIRNIAKCIYTSRSQWVWVFSDDDHILLHSLPYLLSALRELTPDTVFARALCAKVSEKGLVSFVEKQKDSSPLTIIDYMPGINIASHGSIHSLAFLGQTIINTSHWNQDYHDKIYRGTDLYTFVLTLLHECAAKKAVDLNIHIVAATDRGDRSYYTSNMCVARLTEYTSYEQVVHAALGPSRARKALSAGRKGLLRLRIASVFKLISYSSSYEIQGVDPVSYMCSYRSPYWLDVFVVRSLAFIGKIPSTKSAFSRIYEYLSKSSKSTVKLIR
jgi:glycosyltransferase involved in cell wall biosynthesis